MSDPSAELHAALVAGLQADAGVTALVSPARIYDIPPQNPPKGAGKPYIVYGQFTVSPDLAQCFDGSLIDWTGHVWSLTSPPGTLEAKRIAAAVLACVAPTDGDGNHIPPAWTLPGFNIATALPRGVDHLTNPADQSAHSIVRVRYAIDRA